MHTDDFHRSLPSLFTELVHGVPEGVAAFALNPGDAGLLASLDQLSADQASRSANSGATIAAHVDHLRYGLSLMNRWAGGEKDPFHDADWSQAWQTTAVTETQWAELRRALRGETERWLDALKSARAVRGIELDGVIGTVIHLGYHLGAIRQIAANARGPKATPAS
ncbi:MAG TPA: hypothetical protein VGD27_01650 [Longimicrobiales bacterium]